jgi:phage terminase large subunit
MSDLADLVRHQIDWKKPNYDSVMRERSERLVNLSQTPELRIPLLEFYKDKPAQFCNDWLVTYDPRAAEIGLNPVMPFILFPKQEEYLNWLYARWRAREDGVVEKSRDMGASWLCCAFAVWMWLCHSGTVVGIGSRKEEYVDKLGDPKSLFWKLRELINYLPPQLKPPGYEEKKHAPSMRVINPDNGASIIGEAGDNIGRGARASCYFVDEAAFLERPEAVDAALSQTSNCKFHVSTPNGSGNPFYQKAHGGRIPKFVFDWKEDPRKDKEWYEKQCSILDPVVVAQEINRDYEASVSNAFIPGELVTTAMSRGPADIKPNGGLRVGIDVARFGNDSTVFSFRRGRVLLKQVILNKLDVMQVAARARAEINAYNEPPEQIAVDTIGIGSGVADALRGYYPDKYERDTNKRIRTVVDVNAALRMDNGIDFNMRAYMWREMKEWIKEASLPNEHDLRTDLTALRYGFRGGELLLESKEDAKKRGVKSPDRGDSLALTFAIPTVVKPSSRLMKRQVPVFAAFDDEVGY